MMTSMARGQEDVEDMLKKKFLGLEENHPMKRCYQAMIFSSSLDSVGCFMHWKFPWETLCTFAFNSFLAHVLVRKDFLSAAEVRTRNEMPSSQLMIDSHACYSFVLQFDYIRRDIHSYRQFQGCFKKSVTGHCTSPKVQVSQILMAVPSFCRIILT